MKPKPQVEWRGHLGWGASPHLTRLRASQRFSRHPVPTIAREQSSTWTADRHERCNDLRRAVVNAFVIICLYHVFV